jgi:hypothetical protein
MNRNLVFTQILWSLKLQGLKAPSVCRYSSDLKVGPP